MLEMPLLRIRFKLLVFVLVAAVVLIIVQTWKVRARRSGKSDE